MRVALNLVFLVPGQTGGMETYARELVERLAAVDGLDLTCFVNREAAAAGGGPWGNACPMQVVPVRATNRVEWVLGEQWHVPRMASRGGVDIVHSLASTAPLWGSQCRVTTVHDLNFLTVPEAHLGLASYGMRVLVPAAVRRSTRVIADSQSTAEDLTGLLGVERAKIDVVPLGAPEITVPSTPAGDDSRLMARIGANAREIVLCPGAKRPHKNATSVVEAIAGIPEGTRPLLVITGYPTPYEDVIRARADELGVAADVSVVDYLSADEMSALYRRASLVVVASRYEGFGLPVLEAMAREVPVVTSNRSSLPEVAGDAAVLVDPDDFDALRDAISRVLADDGLRADLARRGLERAADYSWDETVRLTVQSYERAMGRSAS